MSDPLEGARAVLADVPGMSEESFAAVRARVLAGRPARRVRGGRAALTALSAVVACGLALTAVFTLLTPPSADAATTLNRAARELAVEPWPGPGQYLHTRRSDWAISIEDRDGKRFRYRYESVSEVWQPADWRTGTWFQRTTLGDRREWIEGDEAAARAAGVVLDPLVVSVGEGVCGEFVPQLGPVETCGPGSWRDPTPDFVDALPRDPEALRAALVRESAGGDPVALASGVLSSGRSPREVTAALYEALAGLPGVRVSDSSADLRGRIGTGLTGAVGPTSVEIVIDPATGEYLGERVRLGADWEGLPAGTVLSSTSVSRAVVDSHP